MRIWRRIGVTVTLATSILVFVLWTKLLPFAFFLLFALYVLASYFTTVRKVTYRCAPFVIAALAIPTGCFIYSSGNSLFFWLTDALAILGGGGVSLLLFDYDQISAKAR